MEQTSSKATMLQAGVWLMSLVVVALAVIAWGQSVRWNFDGLLIYQIFPVLGLTAFSLMWTHYVASVVRQMLKQPSSAIRQWFVITSWAVLILICLHPGLLIWQLWRDGFGLPPGSYEKVYGWVTLVGTASLLVFLSFELHRWYAKKPWWKFIGYLTDIAMLAIVYHSLKLGTQLQRGWFKGVWWFYAVTLVAALVYQYAQKFQAKRPA